MNRILIIGATGHIGALTVSQLCDSGGRVRAMLRDPDSARLPREVERMRGDLTAPETVDACLADIDTVFLVWTAPPATVTPVIERIAAKASRIVFLSAPLKTPHPLFQQPNPGRVMAEKIEREIESSGLEWTFLRPGMFAVNSLAWWASKIRAGETIRWPYLSVPTAPIHERDIATVAVKALCEQGHAGAEYLITGPQALTHREQLETIGKVIGKELRIEEMSPAEAQVELGALFSPAVAKMLLDAWGAAAGHPAFMTDTVERLTGTRARSFGEWVQDHAGEF